MDTNNESTNIPPKKIKVTNYVPSTIRVKSVANYDGRILANVDYEQLKEIAKKDLASQLALNIIENIRIQEYYNGERNKIFFSTDLEILIEKREVNKPNRELVLNLIEQLQKNPDGFMKDFLASELKKKIENNEIFIG